MSSELTIARPRLSYRPGWTPVPRLARKKICVRSAGDARQGSTGVVDDLRHSVPIAPAELEVIETYLGSVIDQLLRGDGGNNGSKERLGRKWRERIKDRDTA